MISQVLQILIASEHSLPFAVFPPHQMPKVVPTWEVLD